MEGKPLIIITTYDNYLPQSQDDAKAANILFSKERTEKIVYNAEQKDGKNELAFYRLKLNQAPCLVFGTKCLEKSGQIAGEEKLDHFKTLSVAIFNYLINQEGKTFDDLSEVIFIMHGFDLGSKESFKLVERYDYWEALIQALKGAGLYNKGKKSKELVEFQFLEEVEIRPGVPVKFLAFTHAFVPWHRFKQELLFEYKYKGRDVDKHLAEIVNDTISQQPKFKEDQIEYKDALNTLLKKLTSKFQFSFPAYYNHNNRSFVGDKNDSKGAHSNEPPLWKVNIIFIKSKFIDGNEGLHFYKAMVEQFHPVTIQEKRGYKTSFKHSPAPIIFIGDEDIMSHQEEGNKNFGLDPHYRFLDSSIWYRYVARTDYSKEKNESRKAFSKNLERTLEVMAWAYEHGLYRKDVCQEHLEFSNRLIANSYLSGSLGHASHVFPFVFHSETFMEKKAEGIAEKFHENNLKWNFLLIDDFAKRPLRENGQDPPNGQRAKGEIIKALIDHTPGQEGETLTFIGDIQFEISVHDVTCSKEDSKKQPFSGSPWKRKVHDVTGSEEDSKPGDNMGVVYDIILLDYLFSVPDHNLHYGSDLLEAIDENTARLQGKSILQKYWIHPISVFPEAMLSAFQEKSLQHIEKNWLLARGADPINTPSLFRCSLYEFMQVQFQKLELDEPKLWRFLAYISILETGEHKVNTGKALAALYQLLEEFSAIEGAPKGSAIRESVYDMLQNEKYRAGKALLDHLRQLLYLLAYSKGFDAEAIEREYLALRDLFQIYKKEHWQEAGKDEFRDLAAIEEAMRKLAISVYSIYSRYGI